MFCIEATPLDFMSYPNPYPYHEDGYSSMPTTPRTPYPWDVQDLVDANSGAGFHQHQAPQAQQQQQDINLNLYDQPAPSPNPNPPLQVIRLEERAPPPARATKSSSQRRDSEDASHERPEGQHKPRIRVDTNAAGPSRASVEPAARAYHPYRRPQTGHSDASSSATGSGSGSRRRDESQSQSHVRFAGQGQPQGSMSAPRIANLGSSIRSTRCVPLSVIWLDAVVDVCRPRRPVLAFRFIVLRWPAVRAVSPRNRNLRQRKTLLSRRRASSSFVQMSTTTLAS